MSKLHYYFLLIGICLSFFFLAGCSSGFDKIDYCWTSEHHLSPDDRIVALDAPIDQVTNLIIQWVENKTGGEIVTTNKDTHQKVTLAADANKKYVSARAIAEKEWAAYEANKYRKWATGEWETLQALMKEQLNTEESDIKSYYIKAKLEKRQATINYRVQTGTSMVPMYNPGFTAYSPMKGGFKTITYPSTVINTPMPSYETRQKTIDFVSLLEIYLYEDGQFVKVYAKASPLDESTSVTACYGCSIGRSFWEYVTGEKEAMLVQELLTFLQEYHK